MAGTISRLAVVAGALGAELRSAVSRARSLGIEGMLVDAYSGGLNLPELSASGLKELGRLLSSQQMRMVGLRMELGANGFGPTADIDRELARIEKTMKVAADLRSGLLCLDLGPLPAAPAENRPRLKVSAGEAGLIIIPTLTAAPAPEITREPTPAEIDPNFVAAVDGALVELGGRADRYSCMVALRSELAPFSALERAVKVAGCPWFGIDLDPVAILPDHWTTGEVFDHLGPIVRHVRARDAVKGSGSRTQAAIVGKGSVNWSQIVKLLNDTGYRGWITLDPMELSDRSAAIGEGLGLLGRL